MMGTDEPSLLNRWLLLGEMMRDGRLTDASRRLGWAILDHVNKKTGDAWPSYERLVAVTGLSRASVGRGVKLLLDEGYFSHIQGGGNRLSQYPGERNGLSNRYRPLFDKCPQVIARLQSTRSSGTNNLAAAGANEPTRYDQQFETFLQLLIENEGRRIPLEDTLTEISGPHNIIDDVF